MKPYVFIAGRYGDFDGFLAIERRIGRAREHAAQLARAGIPYFCPHLNSAHFEAVVPDVPVEFWLRLDEVFRSGASALLVVTEEHAESAGTMRDIGYAESHGIPVYWTASIQNLIADWPELALPATAAT